ncbi:peptidoglycan DD-metalloendopeptidase family protein [Brachybacterium muris]|uniref:M23 family metallopeptidase n=1 Tax=Brachybacterium muris TaxID=219301 RepID=UPI0021A5D851|nr:M23 family metallopeptidase [Brachybacterium muris]MCT1429923.1 peptidoglycan DD-metalloendopeptidase family protein [Brachybacterium muris]
MSYRLLRRPLSIAATAVLVLSPLLAVPSPALADGDKEDKIAERETVQQQLEDIRLELDGVNDDLADTYMALAETELLIPDAQQALDDAREELAAAEDEDRKVGERLSAAEDEEKELETEVATGQDEVDRTDGEMAQVALAAYKGDGMPNPATVFVGGSPQDTVDRTMNYRLTMASQGSKLDTLRTDQAINENSADRLTAVREEIDDLKAEAEETLARKTEAEEEATTAKQELDDLYARQQEQRDELEGKKEQYEGDQANLESRNSTLDDEISELARKERERAEQEASSGGPAPAVAPSGNGWTRPVNARLNSNFGWRVHPIYHTRRLHSGVDFPAACGVPVGATQSGRVIQRTYNSAAGNKIVLSHGMHNGKLITSSYHHLQGFALPVGASVSAGQTVGYVGSTGGSTGCHLHFEIHEDGNAVNPAKYL